MAADGAPGLSLKAEPFSKTFWTLSAWRDQEALDAFVLDLPHARTMRDFRSRLREPVFVRWTVPRGALPVDWPDALSRIAGSGPR